MINVYIYNNLNICVVLLSYIETNWPSSEKYKKISLRRRPLFVVRRM